MGWFMRCLIDEVVDEVVDGVVHKVVNGVVYKVVNGVVYEVVDEVVITMIIIISTLYWLANEDPGYYGFTHG